MQKQRVKSADDAGDSSADAAAFRAAVRDVTPLPQSEPPAGLEAHVRRRRSHAPHEPHEQHEPHEPALGPGDPLSFRRAGVRDQVMRRLRRGSYPIESQLDLHGLGQAHARDLLAEFLASGRHAGLRCVHGKGYRSGARGPVLKTAVNLWLRRHLDVLAFTSARPIDGGTGAVYVLLRAR